MGLRINHNIASITALRNLKLNDRNQQRSLERLSTGLRINRASDDPSGLVISERLRAQINGLKQAVENSQNASNLIGTTEAALNEVHTLLVGLRESFLFAINDGGSSPDQIAAEQDSVDNTISAIERVAATTRFGTRPLLNGVSGFHVTNRTSGISELTLRNIQFGGASQIQFDVRITQGASQAAILSQAYASSLGNLNNDATVRITGMLGVEEIHVTSATTMSDFTDAVNALAWNTGVWASGGIIKSIDYGSSQSISLEVIEGSFNTVNGVITAADGTFLDDGADVTGSIEGNPFTGVGNKATMVSNFFTGDILFTDGQSASQDFTVKKSGLTFQLGGGASMADRETVGLISMNPSTLGGPTRTVNNEEIGGYLTSLLAGSKNDLFNNPANALRIVDAAIDDVSDMRAYLGAFQAFTIDSNVNSLEVAIENLVASESSIRDLDFAEETANYTRTQILYQAGIAVMAQANLIPQAVLTLLQ